MIFAQNLNVFSRALQRKIRVASLRIESNMNLAAILGFCLLNAGWLSPAVRGAVPQAAGQPPAATSSESSTQQSQGTSASQPQEPPAQKAEPAQPAPAPTSQTPSSPAQPKPSATKPRRHRKTSPNCSDAPTALNTAVGKPADSANSADAGANNTSNNAGSVHPESNNPESNNPEPTNPGSPDPGSNNPGSTDPALTNPASKNADTAALKPCPPPKKVVRNGGSSEPKVQLTGGTTAQQAANKSSTEQLKAATEENLKKAAGLQLNPSQKEMVSQIKQFMEQSKAAVAAGDLERGHNLALKAQLLSDELVKP